jgi:hypothetical protein
MTTLAHRTQRGRERYSQALAYAWGRDDAGDRRLRELRDGSDHAFATYAANLADAYDRELTTSLANIADQYRAFVAAHTPGSRFVVDATGDVFEVLTYVAGTTFAVVVDGPHGCPSTLPVGERVAFTPNVLAGYRLVAS